MLSVHDNTCSGYRFSGVERQLVLETEYPCGSDKEGQRSDIVFDGVWCHHLESVQDGNIIFDIEEVDIAQVESEFRCVFDRLKNYGWPHLETKNDTLPEIIERHDLIVYRIHTSYGLEGFVVAKSARQTNSEQAAPRNR